MTWRGAVARLGPELSNPASRLRGPVALCPRLLRCGRPSRDRYGKAFRRMPPARKKSSRPAKRARTVAAEKFDPGEALHGYDGDFLECRDVRHRWSIVGYFNGSNVVQRRMLCDRCGTQRLDRLHTSGHREHPRYEYPNNYRIGRVSPAQVVAEVLDRVQIYASEDQLLKQMMTPAGARVSKRKR